MLNKIIEKVKAAGEIMLTAERPESSVTAKEGSNNFVTKYDVAVQEFLFKELGEAFPQAKFVGEEGKTNVNSRSLRFVIDPIDGTTNFMHDYKCSCISVALCEKDEPVVGVVYNPYTAEIFTAEKGKGAYLNGKKIAVSSRSLANGLALFGTSPYRPDLADETFALLRKVYDYSRDIRRSGSAAYDICQVACGRCEVFFERELQPWDYAAGWLILNEAGGIAQTYDGKKPSLSSGSAVIFANQNAVNEFYELLNN